jgi:hypothetical protein
VHPPSLQASHLVHDCPVYILDVSKEVAQPAGLQTCDPEDPAVSMHSDNGTLQFICGPRFIKAPPHWCYACFKCPCRYHKGL